MSDPKNPKPFEDQDDAEATIMAPNMGQNFAGLIPPTAPPPSAPSVTPPPASYTPGLTPPPASYNPPGSYHSGSYQPPFPGGATQPDTPDPFVQQNRPAPNLPESEETRMLATEGDDISSEQTMVVGGLGAQLLIPLAKLVILEGIQKGKEYPLLGKEISFGREKDNAISYPDLSVSRHHFKIHCDGDKFQLEDLGSGNGTALNQKKVNGTVPLKHGDQIRVGKSVLQFVLVGKDVNLGMAPRPASNNTLVFVLLAVFLLLGGVGITVIYLNNNAGQGNQNNNDDSEAKRRIQVRSEIMRGVKLRTRGKLLEAKLAFQQALQLAPKNLEARQLLDDTTADIRTSHFLRKAHFLVTQASDTKNKEDKIKVYKDAKVSLNNLEKTMPPGSTFAPKVWGLLTQVNRELNKLQGEDKPTPPPTPPPAPVEWGHKTYRACRRECKGRRKRCRRFRRKINGKSIRRYLCVKRGEKPPKPPKPVVTPPPQPRQTVGKFAKAEKLYQSGDLTAAAAAFGAAGDNERKQRVEQFSKLFYKSLADYRSYNPDQAIPSLRRALKEDLIIGEGKRSVYTRQLKQMLANMYFSKGLLLMNRQSFAEAFGQFMNALRHKRNHANAKQKLQELSNLAKQWLGRGKAMLKSDPDQAKQFLRKVRRITRPSDPVRKEAEKLLR